MSEALTQALTIVVPVIISLVGGGGGVWAFMQARTSKQLGVRQNDLERESTTVTGFRQLVESLTGEVDRLREDRDEDRREMCALRESQAEDRAFYTRGMDEMRAKHGIVVEENRQFRVVILGVVEHLRRVPPPEHGAILEFMLSHLPWLGDGQRTMKETTE